MDANGQAYNLHRLLGRRDPLVGNRPAHSGYQPVISRDTALAQLRARKHARRPSRLGSGCRMVLSNSHRVIPSKKISQASAARIAWHGDADDSLRITMAANYG